MEISRFILPGGTEMLVLSLLSEKDMYGYEIISTLRSRSKNVFEMKSGTLYPVLHSLQKQGALTSSEKPVLGRIRIVYHLTEKGQKILEAGKRDWETFSSAVDGILTDGGSV